MRPISQRYTSRLALPSATAFRFPVLLVILALILPIYALPSPQTGSSTVESHGFPHRTQDGGADGVSFIRKGRTWAASFANHGLSTASDLGDYADPPRVPMRSRRAHGWLARWLSIGGEGLVTVELAPSKNFTLPHRPAAFPSQLYPPTTLPLSGFVLPFTTLMDDHDSFWDPASFRLDATPFSDYDTASGSGAGTWPLFSPWIPKRPVVTPEQACLPLQNPPPPYEDPERPYKIALVERGGCDFATKVRAAQDRGASGVIVGDGTARDDESDEEGMQRENLITMFSPEDTEAIYIPSVFISRASYLLLKDMLEKSTDSGRPEGRGLWVELGKGTDEGGALSSLLSFALLMPSLFLLATIAVHRVRVARQREADRAPPLLVLSLPERIWTPDIVWEKDSDSESTKSSPHTPTPTSSRPRPPNTSHSSHASHASQASRTSQASQTTQKLPPPPPISPAEVPSPPPEGVEPLPSMSSVSRAAASRKKRRTKSGISARKYFSKDECAICMDSFQRGEIVRILPCGHVFHKDECDEWLLKWRKLCPTCRADVTLPTGGDVQGATITPVAPPTEEDELGWSSRMFRMFGQARAALPFRRTGGALEGIEGERTPLIDRIGPATPSRGANRQTEDV